MRHFHRLTYTVNRTGNRPKSPMRMAAGAMNRYPVRLSRSLRDEYVFGRDGICPPRSSILPDREERVKRGLAEIPGSTA
jgi:hypothetical protein